MGKTNKTLLIVFVALLVLYGLNRLLSGRGDSNFNSELIKIDTAAVSAVNIIIKQPEEAEITLKREGADWIVSNGQLSVKAQSAAVEELLSAISLIKTNQIAATQAGSWADYGVDEEHGTQVTVYSNDKELESFVVGKFSFNPQTQTAISFLRINGENEVYAIDGMQAMSLNKSFEGYRNLELLKMKRDMVVTSFNCELPDTTLRFSKTGGPWLLNGKTPLDSMDVENYLNTLRNLPGATFADDFDETRAEKFQYARLTLEGDNIPAPFVVDCYRDTSRQRPFILHSSHNRDAWFDSDTSGVYRQLFLNVKKLGRL
ncbi:MAG: DUF4340 domain-containing protein [Saprospiraceae bacterium]|nr:DUF4340 domain-containing protein [Saprospiraceae bacterium]